MIDLVEKRGLSQIRVEWRMIGWRLDLQDLQIELRKVKILENNVLVEK